MSVLVLAGDSQPVTLAATAVAGVRPSTVVDLVASGRTAGYVELVRYPTEDVAPQHASVIDGMPALDFAETARRIGDLDAVHDEVLVLGRHRLLTPYRAGDRWTLIDLASSVRAAVALVVRAAYADVEWVALALGRLVDEGIACPGVLVVDWPAAPDRTHWYALTDLAASAPVLGVLPADLATGRDVQRRTRAALAPQLGGTFDAARFVARGH